jgi:hypothetical protein
VAQTDEKQEIQNAVSFLTFSPTGNTMEHNIALLFRSCMTSPSQSCVAQLLHASTGGILCNVCAEETNMECHTDSRLPVTENILEKLYYSAMISKRGAIFDVPVEFMQATTAFVRDKRAILTELKTFIVCVSPDEASQSFARETIAGLSTAGIDGSQIQLLFLDAPSDVQFESCYSMITKFAHEAGIPIAPAATLNASPVFEKARQSQLPIAAVINGTVDFDAELAAARTKNAPEKLRLALAAKAIAQRSLLTSVPLYQAIVLILGLPRISQEEWQAESSTSTIRKRLSPTAN